MFSLADGIGAAARGAPMLPDRTVESPEVSTVEALAARRADWAMLDCWYDGSQVYSTQAWPGWGSYIRRHNLPAWIRAVYNPVARAVDWYPGHLFRGAWSEDGRALPDGTPHIIPIPDDILTARPGVVTAAMQGLAWSNFRSVLFRFIAGLGLHGNAFFEIDDDLEGEPTRRKVKATLIPLWQVKDVELNAGGDVKRYVLEFLRRDDREQYTYRKEVDGEQTRVFHDDKLIETSDHEYGFCPGVWVPFRLRRGDVLGSPLVQGVIPKLDRINGHHATVEAYTQKILSQPFVFIGQGQLKRVVPPTERTDAAGRRTVAIEEGTVPLIFFDAPNGQVVPMMGQLNIADAETRIANLIAEVESDLPEIVFDEQMREMDYVSKPGADGMVGDVRARYDEVMGNVDAGLVKVAQMIVSIGSHRAHNGFWGDPAGMTKAQKKFLIYETALVTRTDAQGNRTEVWEATETPVGLESFARGAIDLAIAPRPLIPLTLPQDGTLAHEQMLEARVRRVEATEALQTDWGLAEMEVPEARAKEISAARKARAEDLTRAFNRGAVGVDPAGREDD